MAAAPVISDDPRDLRGGGFPAWPLPLDARAAAIGRSLVRPVLGGLGMPAELTYDIGVALSELVTNAYVHAHGDAPRLGVPASAPPEMWVYLRWTLRPEVVLKVFDATPARWPVTGGVGPFPAMGEGGRGLEVVYGLTAAHGGRWGVHRTRSRLGVRTVPGKAVFLVVPVPPHCVASAPVVPKTPGQIADQVHDLLDARRLGRLRRTTGHGITVICVRAGVHVWIRDDAISYCVPGRAGVRLDLRDSVDAVEQIVRHCAEFDAGYQ